LETIDIQIKSNIPQAEAEVGSYKKQIRELRKEIDALTPGTEQYDAALQKLANTMHDYREEQELVQNSAADLGTAIGNVHKVATGVAAGFSAVNAIMTLTGNNSEALQKTMVKLQASIAFVQGMQGLEGLTKNLKRTITSVKAFGASIGVAMGPLTVIIGALATVGAGLSYIANLNADKQVDRLTESFNAVSEAVAKTADELEFEVQMHEAAGQSAEDSANERIQNVDEIIAAYRRLIKQEEKMKAYYSSTGFWGWLTGDNKARKQLDENIQAYNDLIKEQETNRARIERQRDLSITRENTRRRQEAARQAAADKKQRERESAAAIAQAKAQAAAIAKAEQDAIEQIRKQWQEYFDDLVTQFQKTTGSIVTTINSMSGLSISTPGYSLNTPSDLDAFLMIYGISSDEMKQKMKGALLGLLYDTNKMILDSNADLDQKLAAQDELRKQAVQVLSSDIVEQILATEVNISDIFDPAGNLLLHFESTLPKFESTGAEIAAAIPEAFKKQYDALKQLYEEGIINEDEYRANLLNIEKEYQDTVTKMRNELAENDTLTAEQRAAIIYELERKPLDFAQEVFSELKTVWEAQFDEFKNNISSIEAAAQVEYDKLTTANSTWTGLYGRSLQDTKAAQDSWILGIDSQIAELDKLISAINNELSYEQYSNEQKMYLLQQLDEAQTLYDEKQRERIKATAEFSAENFQKIIQISEESFSAGANLISGINEIFNARIDSLQNKAAAALEAGNEEAAKRYEEQAKEEFETSKGLQKAQAILSGLAGVAQAIAGAMQLGPIAGPIVGAINAAAVTASTVAQVMAIDNTQFKGSNSSSSIASAPDTSFTLQSTDAYQNTLSNEVQTDLQSEQRNNRVYVVESDIQRAQDNARTTVTTATF